MSDRWAATAGASLQRRTLPFGWAWATLGEMADTRLGKMLSKKARSGNGTRPYLRNKNVQWGRIDLDDLLEMDFADTELERFRVRPGDVLVCEGGEVGRAAIWRGQIDWIGYQKALHRVRPQGGIAPEYLLYVFTWLAQTNAFDPHVTGSTIKHLPQEDLRLLRMPLAPLNEQRRIVAAIEEHLSRLDAADASLAAALRRLAALSSQTVAGAVQGDWDVVPLREVTDLQVYGTSAKASSEPNGVPVLRMGNIDGGKLDFANLKYLPDDHPDVEKLVLEPGDLLFNRTNSPELVGKSAVFTAAERMTFASYLIRVRLTESCDPHWAALVINGPPGRNYIASVRSQQVGQANVNGTKLAALPLPLPPLSEQRRIVAEVEERLSRIDAMRASIERAQRRSKALRAAILERAFRGELVPQDPSDEPAEALLARIRAEKDETKGHQSTK